MGGGAGSERASQGSRSLHRGDGSASHSVLPASRLGGETAEAGAEAAELTAWLTRVFPQLHVEEGAVANLLTQARAEGSVQGGPAAAVEWAGGFTLPPAALAADAKSKNFERKKHKK